MYTFFMKHKELIGQRPPLPLETREQIRDLTNLLNNDALKPFIPHDLLVMAVDRAWCSAFPDKVSKVKRKKYEKFPF